MNINLTVIIEEDEDGMLIASVPSLKGCYTQAETMTELLEKIKEVAKLCLEVEHEMPYANKFIGVQQMEVTYAKT